MAAASADGVVLSSPEGTANLESRPENHPPATAVPLHCKEGAFFAYHDAVIESAGWLATGEFLSDEELARIDPAEAHKLILLRAVSA